MEKITAKEALEISRKDGGKYMKDEADKQLSYIYNQIREAAKKGKKSITTSTDLNAVAYSELQSNGFQLNKRKAERKYHQMQALVPNALLDEWEYEISWA